MSQIIYKIGTPNEFTEKEKEVFVELLKKQKKVVSPSIEKINRCKTLCACFCSDEIVSIGAIKPKTISDFNSEKANLETMRNNFDWELGYCFTLSEYRGKGHSSAIVTELLKKEDTIDLIASTELDAKNPMVGILEKFGFSKKGRTWRSQIHGGELGLFVRIKN